MAIVIRPPSITAHYDEFWSGDPAFIQPAELAARFDGDLDKAKIEHARLVQLARETGNWGDLAIEGATPTKFVLQPLPGTLYRKLIDLGSAGRIGHAEMAALVLRIALVEVVDFGDVKVKRVQHELFGKMATDEVPNLLDACAPGAVAELAQVVLDKAGGLPKK